MTVRLRKPHPEQRRFLDSPAKRKILRAGRRGGKTTVACLYAVKRFLDGARVLYAAPTADQLQAFWFEVQRALREPIDAGLYVCNQTEHSITMPQTKQRIRGKTAWNADTLRGDYADELILDELQMMEPSAWNEVGAPMLLDNDGTAVFIYTPPRPYQNAHGYKFAAALFARGAADETGEWEAFHFTSHDNPHLSRTALKRMASDMTADAYQREIMAEDSTEDPSALWTRAMIDASRVDVLPPSPTRIVVGVDPPGGETECGIVAAAVVGAHVYIFADRSVKASPQTWGRTVISLAQDVKADIIVGEKNYGGDMVEHVIAPLLAEAKLNVRFKMVTATRGKAVRAEPVVAGFERGSVHIVGSLSALEDEMCVWVPGSTKDSPNRVDAAVWAVSELTQVGGSVRFGGL